MSMNPFGISFPNVKKQILSVIISPLSLRFLIILANISLVCIANFKQSFYNISSIKKIYFCLRIKAYIYCKVIILQKDELCSNQSLKSLGSLFIYLLRF